MHFLGHGEDLRAGSAQHSQTRGLGAGERVMEVDLPRKRIALSHAPRRRDLARAGWVGPARTILVPVQTACRQTTFRRSRSQGPRCEQRECGGRGAGRVQVRSVKRSNAPARCRKSRPASLIRAQTCGFHRHDTWSLCPRLAGAARRRGRGSDGGYRHAPYNQTGEVDPIVRSVLDTEFYKP